MDLNSAQLKERALSYLTQDEVYSIETMLGREPNPFEMNMFAAMWSEHISYKSSIKWLEEMPVEGKDVYVPAREENAGVIHINDELGCVVKMESHNHPIAVDPRQGAVGVGNVNRDLISMGAEPVGQLNILRFGNPKMKHIRDMVNAVVAALGSYSNNFGVPVVGGEILFDDSYNFNPLVNLMSVGIVHKSRMIKATLSDVAQVIVLLGKKTSGRGVHGAGFASKAIKNKGQMVPDSQIADPASGKILMDCIHEVNGEGLIDGMQDIGAGGVLCAAAEMAFRGRMGVEIQLDKIPLLREDIDALGILLSQTQEQMLLAVHGEDVDRIRVITDRWGLEYTVIGSVTEGERIRIVEGSTVHGDLPVQLLVRGGGAPVYIRDMKSRGKTPRAVSAEEVPVPGNLKNIARTMVSLPNIASRRWIYEQFDTMAGLSNLSSEQASDAGIVKIDGYEIALAMSVDGNSRYGRLEPRTGAMIAVAEASRNIICSGGRPLAVADCLNYGDPSDPFVYYDFAESVKGISEVCRRMEIPVIAGNVSFYNLTYNGEDISSVIPTPVIGMVGILDSHEEVMTVNFRNKGDMIFLIGRSDNDISSSEYLSFVHLINESAAPKFDLDYEMKLQDVVGKLIKNQLVKSAHDVSLGGLFVTLVECALPGGLGFDITSPAEIRSDAFLFGESQSRVVVSVSSEQETDFLDYMMEIGIHFSALGHVTKEEFRIDDVSFGFISDYARDFENALESLLGD
ncbi:MAG: phosphoribosylformylglycinamidine synthase subunit PurL [Bacteroidales bacterium]|nr:phosphoribosylformylglycinamidine synthase subunit PurL [Bacteroidales bacterium]